MKPLLIVVALLAVIGATAILSAGVNGPVAAAALATAGLGALVGVSELVSRYTDAPEQALSAWPGRLYIAVNVLATGAAFGLAHGFDLLSLADKPLPARLLTETLVAGLGAMAFFRSAVFTVRIGGNDVAVGPASLLQLILNAVDRACDRARAQPRAAFVSRLMNGISFNAAADILPQFCFSAMQNVSGTDQQAVFDWVKYLKSEKTGEDQKSLLLGPRLLNIVGDKVLEATIEGLGPRIRSSLSIGLTTLIQLREVDFKKSTKPLIAICYALVQGTITIDRDALGDKIDKIGGEEFANDVAVLLVASELLKIFGDDVVGRALAMVVPTPLPPPPPPAPAGQRPAG